MDVPLQWRAKHTILLDFCCVVHVAESISGFLTPKYECSACSQILRREKSIHHNKSPMQNTGLDDMLSVQD